AGNWRKETLHGQVLMDSSVARLKDILSIKEQAKTKAAVKDERDQHACSSRLRSGDSAWADV
ncbi:unnamed protein product, partial [Effrenium voratum]